MNPPPSHRRIIAFLKAPRPSLVKTRIAAQLDPEAAAGIYRVLLLRTLRALASFPSVELRFTPDDAAPEFQPLAAPTWILSPQGDGDLGNRLARAAQDASAAGVSRFVIIGSDVPDLTAADLDAAFTALDTHDVVLGPASDGGYWLLGLRQPQPCLLEGITWSSPQVLAQTLDRARNAGLAVAQLRILRDIDTLADWRDWVRSHAEAITGNE